MKQEKYNAYRHQSSQDTGEYWGSEDGELRQDSPKYLNASFKEMNGIQANECVASVLFKALWQGRDSKLHFPSPQPPLR